MISRLCGTISLIGQTNKNGTKRYLQKRSLDITQMMINGILSAVWNSCCKTTAIQSYSDIAHGEFMLSGKLALGDQETQTPKSFCGSSRMGAYLLEMHILTRSTSQLGLVAEVMVVTVLRCLMMAGLRLWMEMAKQCGVLIRPKLFAKEVTNTQTTSVLSAITEKQLKSVKKLDIFAKRLELFLAGSCIRQETISQMKCYTSTEMSIF